MALNRQKIFLFYFGLPNPQLFSPPRKHDLKYLPVCPNAPDSDFHVSDHHIFSLFLW